MVAYPLMRLKIEYVCSEPGNDPARRIPMKNRNDYDDKKMSICRCGSVMYFTNKENNKIGYCCGCCRYETRLHRFPFMARWQWNRETHR